MNKQYREAMQTANRSIESFPKRFPRLLLHIFRDLKFGEITNEVTLVSSKVSLKDVVISLILVVIYYARRNKLDIVVCAQENMFNAPILKGLVQGNRFSSIANPFLGMKVCARLFAEIKIRFSKVTKAKYGPYISVDPLFRRALVNYYMHLYHVLLLKRFVKELYYFSLGSPSYGRYISSRFHEVQHGVLHKAHPAVCSVRKPKGKFLVYRDFADLVHGRKEVIARDPVQLSNVSRNGDVVCFPPLNPAAEQLVEEYVLKRHEKVTVFYHPRSTRYVDELTVLDRLEKIRTAEFVYSGISSTIRDISVHRGTGFKILVTQEELINLEVNETDLISHDLGSIYGVPVIESQIVKL